MRTCEPGCCEPASELVDNLHCDACHGTGVNTAAPDRSGHVDSEQDS